MWEHPKLTPSFPVPLSQFLVQGSEEVNTHKYTKTKLKQTPKERVTILNARITSIHIQKIYALLNTAQYIGMWFEQALTEC